MFEPYYFKIINRKPVKNLSFNEKIQIIKDFQLQSTNCVFDRVKLIDTIIKNEFEKEYNLILFGESFRNSYFSNFFKSHFFSSSSQSLIDSLCFNYAVN